MKILYFHQYFTTPKGAGGVRSYEFAKRWVESGHDVHVITGTAFDPTLPTSGDKYIDGIHITTIGVAYKSEMNFFARVKSFLHYALKATIIAMKAVNYDVVIATSTPLTIAFPALAAKWIARRKVIFEVRDVWPDAAIDAGILRNRALIACARLLEKVVYRSSDHIIPLSDAMEKNISAKGVDNKKMTMIPNCSDIFIFSPKINGMDIRKKYHAENKFVALYTGAVNIANQGEYLIHVADILREQKNIEFWIVGKGNRYEHLRELKKKKNLKNIRFHGIMPRQIIPYYAATADIGLVTFIPEPAYYDNSPNKFFDYIAAGLPVLFNRTTWLEKYLNQYKNGFICDPHKPRTMADNLLMLMNNPVKRKIMGIQSRKLAEEVFSRDRMSKKFLNIILQD